MPSCLASFGVAAGGRRQGFGPFHRPPSSLSFVSLFLSHHLPPAPRSP
uniref:Uncharacterized protein n=1 Tax=Arundo donax TaxID=35708 RepID=A0A0A9CNE3_ARUDO